MGRGDKKTAKGKRFTGSHGNVRAQTSKKPTGVVAATVKAPVAAAKPAAKKAPAKKAAAAK